jgi:hypothetical protein
MIGEIGSVIVLRRHANEFVLFSGRLRVVDANIQTWVGAARSVCRRRVSRSILKIDGRRVTPPMIIVTRISNVGC